MIPRSKTLACTLAFLAAVPCLAAADEDQDRQPSSARYTQASVCGDYAAIATYGANIARALGTEVFDGKGSLTGSAIANQPGPNSTRTLLRIGLGGAYSVNPDGTGKMLLTVALPGGATANVTEDFVITRTKVIDGVRIATEMEDAQETPSAVIDDNSLVVHRYTLRSAPRPCTSRP